ncbi:MAG: DUF899 family protein [Alphaproteobacteria bacterium]
MSTPSDSIAALEKEIWEKTARLNHLRRQTADDGGPAVADYSFATLTGPLRLSDLFAGHDTLLAIHNMGQGCRHCTLRADGLNGLLPHLETAMSVVLLSKDDPHTQQRFAHERGWRFRLASHGGGAYIREQAIQPGHDNYPGCVVYRRDGAAIRRRHAAAFGENDLFCPAWHLLAMAGRGEDDWHPQFSYWRRPDAMDDGGANLPD